MASIRQTAANQRNAELSTGPRTPEGRQASARNSLDHGMTATKLASPTDAALVDDRLDAWRPELKPVGPIQEWQARQIVAASVRIDRCQLEESAWTYEQTHRAEGSWDVDRREEVERLAEGLRKKPARVAAQLRRSLQGCEWLVAQWRLLAELVRDGSTRAGIAPGPLGEEHYQFACDLLGLSALRRLGTTPLDLPAGSGPDADLAAHQAGVIAGQIAELEEFENTVAGPLDVVAMVARQTGVGHGADPTLRLIRRYLADAQRDHRRASEALKKLQKEGAARDPVMMAAESSEPSSATAPPAAVPPTEVPVPSEPPAVVPAPVCPSTPLAAQANPRPLPRPAMCPPTRPLNRRGRRAAARRAANLS